MEKSEILGVTIDKNEADVIQTKWRWRHQLFSQTRSKHDPYDITTKFQLYLTEVMATGQIALASSDYQYLEFFYGLYFGFSSNQKQDHFSESYKHQ